MNDSMESAATGSKKILVVDDTSSVADLIREMLLSFGHQADVCGTVKEALVFYGASKYDLVITDYTMPGTNGVDFSHQLRKQSPQQRIILITGSSYTLTDKSDQPLPVNSILQKPFSVEEFQHAVTTVFSPQRVSV